MSSPAELALGLPCRARDDAYVVERLAHDGAAPDWIIGFHAQQAVEKAIKAVLANANVVFPRTHNIAMLLALLQQIGIQPPREGTRLERLTPFGVAARYDSGLDQSFALDRDATLAEIIALPACMERNHAGRRGQACSGVSMSVPKYHELIRPLLDLLAAGRTRKRREASQELARRPLTLARP